MQAFLFSAECQDFLPPERAEGVQPEQVKWLTCLKSPASPIHTRHIPKKACSDASLFTFCRIEECQGFQPATTEASHANRVSYSHQAICPLFTDTSQEVAYESYNNSQKEKSPPGCGDWFNQG